MTRWPSIGAVVALAVMTSPPVVARQGQRPTFRAGTDVIAVDVQVVDGNGIPILGLGPDRFEVSINRKRRRVVSAELLRFDDVAGAQVTPRSGSVSAGAASTSAPVASNADEGRVFVLAVDTLSFRADATRDLMTAARAFVETLQPNDLVGLFPFPADNLTDLTTDHA